MHASERERLIVDTLGTSGFVAYRELERRLSASPSTIRRDLTRLEQAGLIVRVHGGAKRPTGEPRLVGTPFSQSINLNLGAKQAIGKAAAGLVNRGEGVMIDGGTTTLQMCPHLTGLRCQVLTNSLHIVEALLPQEETGIFVPSGSVFREQNIILAAPGEDSMPRFHAPKLFMGAAAVCAQGIMQADMVLVAAERRLIERAERVILLVDSTKFRAQSGAIVCGLDQIDTIVTDAVPAEFEAVLRAAGVQVLIA